MMHDRCYSFRDVGTLWELADLLYNHTWTPCSAFRCGPLSALNDSTGPDGAQEYAILIGGRQVESLTVSWYQDRAKLQSTLERCMSGALDADMGPAVVHAHQAGA